AHGHGAGRVRAARRKRTSLSGRRCATDGNGVHELAAWSSAMGMAEHVVETLSLALARTAS
ncbi:MAG: hypothetical protein ACR2PL_15400, partial [Dehalococcoidia bacterium]